MLRPWVDHLARITCSGFNFSGEKSLWYLLHWIQLSYLQMCVAQTRKWVPDSWLTWNRCLRLAGLHGESSLCSFVKPREKWLVSASVVNGQVSSHSQLISQRKILRGSAPGSLRCENTKPMSTRFGYWLCLLLLNDLVHVVASSRDPVSTSIKW